MKNITFDNTKKLTKNKKYTLKKTVHENKDKIKQYFKRNHRRFVQIKNKKQQNVKE